MMETPMAMLRAAEIAGAGGRLAVLVMGTSDLVTDLQGRHPDRLGLVTGLGLCLLAARAHGLAILDGVHLDLDDDAGFAAQCRQGVAFGFDGKTLIHPKTIAAANAHFGPDPQAVAWAERIITAHAAARDTGQGMAVVDGKLIENLHVAEAERTLHWPPPAGALAAGGGPECRRHKETPGRHHPEASATRRFRIKINRTAQVSRADNPRDGVLAVRPTKAVVLARTSPVIDASSALPRRPGSAMSAPGMRVAARRVVAYAAAGMVQTRAAVAAGARRGRWR